MVIVAPFELQMLGLSELYSRGSPELALASGFRAKVLLRTKSCDACGPNVMFWGRLRIAIDAVTGPPEEYRLFGADAATIEQVPTLSIVTSVLPLSGMEHIDGVDEA